MSTRGVVASVIAGVSILAAAAGYVASRPRGLFEPEVQIQNEDYAETRRHFSTKLVREGPSPQRDVIVLRPPGYVEEVEFRSGAHRLKAWMSGHQQARQKLPAVLFLHGGFELGAAELAVQEQLSAARLRANGAPAVGITESWGGVKGTEHARYRSNSWAAA